MTRITISCPITWWQRCDWIEKNCQDWKCATEWAAWQIGYDDIYYWLRDEDAIMFALRWT